MTDIKDGCVKAARGPIIKQPVTSSAPTTALKETREMAARVGIVLFIVKGGEF